MTKTARITTKRYFTGRIGMLALAGLLLLGGNGFAQTDSAASFNLYEVNTSDFNKGIATADTLTSGSSLIPLPPQESPGAVTIITQEEIKAMGARDLIDVLNTVPGFQFGVDIEGMVNAGVRGIMSQEAMLLVVDGVEMNDLLYGSTPIMNRFPIDQIEKMEVVLGPGSGVLGGFATYAVINITTRHENREGGFNISNLYGRSSVGETHQVASMSLGTGGYNWKVGAVGSLSRAVNGVGHYSDRKGNCYNVGKYNTASDKFVSSYVEYRDLVLRYMANDYQTTNRDSYNTISKNPHNVDFNSHDVQLRYKLGLGSRTELLPMLGYKFQKPWTTDAPSDPADSLSVLPYNRTVQRIQGGAVLNTSPRNNVKISVGLNQRFEKALNHLEGQEFFNGSNTLKFNTFALFGQLYMRTRLANIVVGGRYENHNMFRPVFAPRVALSRKLGKFSTKVSYTQSYKMPTFENFNLSKRQKIQPQYTTSLEGELRYDWNNRLEVFGNLFKVDTRKGIAYFLGQEYEEGYGNCGKFSTKGIEGGAKVRFARADIQTSYSFYTTKGENTFRLYRVPGRNLNLAYPAHKISAQGNLAVTKSLKLNASILYMSERYSYDMDSTGAGGAYVRHPTTFIVNFFANTRVPIGYGLEAGFGIKDVFNQGITYIQPYSSYHRPLPGLSREFVVRVTYELSNR